MSLFLEHLKFYGNFKPNVMKRYENCIAKENQNCSMTCVFNWRIWCYKRPKPQHILSMKHAKSTVWTKAKVATSRLNLDWLKITSLFASKCFSHTAHDWTNQISETVNCHRGDNSSKQPPASTIRCDDFQNKRAVIHPF